MANQETPFKDVAVIFGRLENTSSATAMTGILARFLPRLAPGEVRITAWLVSGQAGPKPSAPQFGLAQKFAERAIAQACGTSAKRIATAMARTGDLGTVAEELIDWRGSRPTIGQVFTALRVIATTQGAGSQTGKIATLAELLRKVSGLEAKYIVRTVLGTHRIGVAEMTFLNALAAAFGKGADDKPALQHAYNCLSDIGEVAYRAARGGIESLARVKPAIGIPVRMMLAERIADLDEVPLHLKGELFAEYKYDGEQIQVHKARDGRITIFSRRLNDITHQFPEIVAYLRKTLHARDVIIEGEVVAIDRRRRKPLPFQTVMRRKRRHDIELFRTDVPVAAFFFDLLYLNGRNQLAAPLSERKRLLIKHLSPDNLSCIGDFICTDELSEVEDYFHKAISKGAEGVVIKGASTAYEAGHRGWSWIKFKREYEKALADTFDVVIVGATYGKGSRAGRYGSILVAAFDPKTNRYYSFTKVGAGLTDKLLTALPRLLKPYCIPGRHRLLQTGMQMDVWFEPAKVVEISGADLTLSQVHMVARDRLKTGGIALRFPRLLRLRDDKSPEQATTVGEIWEIYRKRTGAR